MKKIISINIFVLLLLLIIIEIIFGHWFKKDNFGIFMRSERNVKELITTEFNEKKYEFIYKRNFYAFRGDNFDASKVKIIFQGGSTGNQRFHPEDKTIVGQLNKFFNKDDIGQKIYNASTDGKSTKGYINDFIFWFPKIPNFKPSIFIFYIGINDSICCPDWAKHYEYKAADTLPKKIRDYIKNNSLIFGLATKVSNKFFPKVVRSYWGNSQKTKNFKFINYQDAKTNFSSRELNKKEKLIINAFKKRLITLDNHIQKNKIIPIFITQIRSDGLKDYLLYNINNELKSFSKKNDYDLIPLDEIINNINTKDFYDYFHTTPSGSKKIAEGIYPILKDIILEKTN